MFGPLGAAGYEYVWVWSWGLGNFGELPNMKFALRLRDKTASECMVLSPLQSSVPSHPSEKILITTVTTVKHTDNHEIL